MSTVKRTFFLILFFSFFSLTTIAATTKIEKLEPEFWWVGMENPNLQLLIYGQEIGDYKVRLDYPGVFLQSVQNVENANYLFVNLQIDKSAKAGKFDITFTNSKGKEIKYQYELKERKVNSSNRKGFNSSDVIYLLMPDRFANGNPENDSVDGLAEKADRANFDGRHGGDIEGIINQLDYLQDLGITALWSTPLLEDNEARGSYHTYAISDYYNVDARFGGNEAYLELSKECKKRGIKLIMDMVFNHCASAHWWMKDLPQKDWVHLHDEYTNSNHRKSTILDPYASNIDQVQFSDGWFDRSMADLNQKNELLMTYLIQNSIWWVEYADLDGIRMDTHPYNDPQGMSKWGKAVLTEYPHLNIVGETWYKSAADIAYWQKDALNANAYNSYMPCVMDFQLFFSLEKAFLEKQQWENGLVRLYKSLASDYLYKDLSNILIFTENHDTDRIMSTLKGDLDKFKLINTFLMTTRGIPQIYAGVEILMEGKKSDGDGKMRIDFPGGWEDDARNAFTAQGRTEKENEAFNFLQKLLQWRKANSVIHSGKLKHYIPQNDVYVYFRFNDEKTVMVILNNGDESQELSLDRFSESIKEFTKGYDILSEKNIQLLNGKLKVNGNTSMVLELK
ncbi:glycoside hydrolase family 13 protein [Marinifilum sp. D737]|uniref:glycoside hydrolase family 13 protein n=1 Tax=Marinifilum sp. D737 TaxID=2969628 RepID=UPI0022727787|nr:glycoside hydrolase family 13 protein [Marinifilum sp. D737]MCY1633780.1 glycoside hydrolase family 13 protein [Marinifilum sp. D737]